VSASASRDGVGDGTLRRRASAGSAEPWGTAAAAMAAALSGQGETFWVSSTDNKIHENR
jgi:hypothetical protein